MEGFGQHGLYFCNPQHTCAITTHSCVSYCSTCLRPACRHKHEGFRVRVCTGRTGADCKAPLREAAPWVHKVQRRQVCRILVADLYHVMQPFSWQEAYYTTELSDGCTHSSNGSPEPQR